jgi:hypothetical protein
MHHDQKEAAVTGNIEYSEKYCRDEEFGEFLEVFHASMPESEASQPMCARQGRVDLSGVGG